MLIIETSFLIMIFQVKGIFSWIYSYVTYNNSFDKPQSIYFFSKTSV